MPHWTIAELMHLTRDELCKLAPIPPACPRRSPRPAWSSAANISPWSSSPCPGLRRTRSKGSRPSQASTIFAASWSDAVCLASGGSKQNAPADGSAARSKRTTLVVLAAKRFHPGRSAMPPRHPPRRTLRTHRRFGLGLEDFSDDGLRRCHEKLAARGDHSRVW
jgi:hypothetical protein